jgi:hypothetical protein
VNFLFELTLLRFAALRANPEVADNPFLPLSDLSNNILRDTTQKANP